MDEVLTQENPNVIEIPGSPEGIKIEQSSTRGDGVVELGETFNRESIDFSGVLNHLSIHTEGVVAGSQFNSVVFETPEAVAAIVRSSLPEALQYDQHGRAELTLIAAGTIVGYAGVKPVAELEGMPGVVLSRRMRVPGGEAAEIDDVRGAWYPEMTRNSRTGRFEVATNPDGSTKNPRGKFEPEAVIAEVDEAVMGEVAATDRVTVIIQKNPANGSPTVLTIFPGENAPAFPVKIQSETYQADMLTGGPEAAYWAEHAFIKPAQPVAA